jgi:aryl-alcohol dehydrogenase-like predicted oxidoreductase
MEKRRLGNTGEMLSVVGFGGIVVMNEEPALANRLVAKAVEERGINYFDVSPSYGNAEERLGPALEPYRKSVFLACKTKKRNAKEATVALHQSLKQMRTDHFDLYQLHEVRTPEEVEEVLGPGGAMEAFVKAREQGLTRYLGFSAHSEEAALALLDRFEFDTILFPINYVVWHQSNFGPQVVRKAQQKGLGILALKSLARQLWGEGETHTWPKCWYAPAKSYEEAELALRFTLSQPVTAAVSPSHAELLWWMCDAAERFRPLSKEEHARLASMSQGLAPVFPIPKEFW